MSDDIRIVPERDELRPRNKTAVKRTSASAADSKSSRPKPAKTTATQPMPRQGSSMMTMVLAVFVVLLSGTCAFLYLQTQNLNTEREILASRVADIESKLSVTDESMSQSGAAMQAVLKEHSEELELHMSEIRKLWAIAYDRNRVAIEALQKKDKSTAARLDSVSGSIAKMDPVLKGYQGMKSQLETISSQSLVQSANLDDLSAQARENSDKLSGATSQLSAQNAALEEIEAAIEAIDQYRIQTNQRLLRMEQSIQSPAQ